MIPKGLELMKLFVVFESIIAITLLLTAYSSGNPLVQIHQEVVAQTSETTLANSTTSASTGSTENKTNVGDVPPGQSVAYRGMEVSKEPTPCAWRIHIIYNSFRYFI